MIEENIYVPQYSCMPPQERQNDDRINTIGKNGLENLEVDALTIPGQKSIQISQTNYFDNYPSSPSMPNITMGLRRLQT